MSSDRKHSPSLLLSAINGALTVAFYGLMFQRIPAGKLSDLFFCTLIIPNVLFTMTYGQLNEMLVPWLLERGPELRRTLYLNALTLVAISAGLLGAVLIWPMSRMFYVFFPRLADVPHPLVFALMALNFGYIVLVCMVMVKNCYLATMGRPVLLQCVNLAGSLSALALLAISRRSSVEVVAFALLGGTAVSVLVPTGTGGKYVHGLFWPNARTLFLNVRWLLLPGVTSKAEPLLDSILAVSTGTGALSAYYMYQRVIGFAHTAVQTGYILPASREIAEAATQDRLSLGILLRSASVGMLATLILLVAACAAVVAAPVVAPNRFGELSRLLTSNSSIFLALLGYSLGVIAAKVTSVGLISAGRQRQFALCTLMAFVAAAALKLAGTWLFGITGLALGTSAAWLGYAVVLLYTFSMARDQQPLTPAKSRAFSRLLP